MSQVSYGTITVSDITDITDVYLEYGLALDNANVDNNYAFDQLGERGWSTDYPNWQSGYQVWIREITQKEGLLPEPGTPYLDKAVNQINNNFINLDNRLRNFFYPGDPSYSGAFAVSKSTADGLDVTDVNTYGFNTRISVASISMGYNKIPLLEMGILDEGNFNGIKLYSPVIDHSTISENRLDATLTSEGLKLLKGGIEAGAYSSTTTDFIYLSTIDYNKTPTVNIGGNTSGWRQIIGSKFGVKNDGTLYAAGAHIDGDIIAQSLTISNGANTYDAINAMNASTYAIAITNDPSNTSIVDPSTTTYLYPILYHGGVRIEPYVLSQDTAIISGKKYYSRSGNTYTEISSPTGNPSENGYYEIDYTHFIWYQDDDTIGTVGSAIDGGIIASYGHTYRVIFNLSDEEVGIAPTVQQLMVDPSKYITRTSDTGITVHPEVQTSTTILQLNDDGLDIVRNGASIAKYGVSARVGADNSSRFLINSASLQAYNNNNQKYFEVSGTGINWGTGATSTTLQLDNEGFEIIRNGVSAAKYGNTTRIGSESSSRFLINTGALQAYDNNNNKYFEVNSNGLTWGTNTAATTTQVNEAAQTANNYISTNSSGIMVYNGESGVQDPSNPNTNTNNIFINDTSLNIRKGATTLASFTTNGITFSKAEWAYLARLFVSTNVENNIDYATLSLGNYDNPSIAGTQINNNGALIARAYGNYENSSNNGGYESVLNLEESSTKLQYIYSYRSEEIGHIYPYSLEINSTKFSYSTKYGDVILARPNGSIEIGNWNTALGNTTLTIDSDGQIKGRGIGSLDGTYEEIFVGNYTTRAQQVNSSLITSSSDDAWLKAVLTAICQDYPNKVQSIFKGRINPNSLGYFEVCIYDTSRTTSGIPQYCHGTWRKWQSTFWIISTSNGTFAYSAK